VHTVRLSEQEEHAGVVHEKIVGGPRRTSEVDPPPRAEGRGRNPGSGEA